MDVPVWFFVAFGVAVSAFVIAVVLKNAGNKSSGVSGSSSDRADDAETDKLCRELSAEELYKKASALVQSDGLKSDYNRWKKFIRASAEKGYIPAVREWGRYNRNKDNAVALKYLTQAAEAGDSEGAEELYKLYYYGSQHGTPAIERDRVKALAVIKPLADKGIAVPQRLVGDYYYYEKDNDNKALEWYLKAAENGDAEAMTQAADIYGFKDKTEEQKKWLLKAAEQNFADAEYALGSLYYSENDPDYIKAMEWYKKASEHGGNTACCHVGNMYLKGEGVEKDEKQAFEWFKKAHEKGSVYGKYLVGKCYFDGTGVKQNKNRGIKLLTEAAKYDSNAQYALGKCFLDGDGVKQDVRKGISILERAAEDNVDAQNKLAEIYYEGKLVKKDTDRAHELWLKAAKNENEDAKELLKIYFHETVR